MGFFEQRCSCVDYDPTTTSATHRNNAAIIGLAVGLGIPLLLALIALVLVCVWCFRTGRWRAENIKHIAGTFMVGARPKQDHETSSTATLPMDSEKGQATAATDEPASPGAASDNVSELFWTPEMPQNTTVVNRGYTADSRQNTIRNIPMSLSTET